MRQLAPGVFQLRGRPANAINAYLVGDVLIDARTRWAARSILSQLRGRTVRAHALTHVHSDHQGASHAVCEELGIPLMCGAEDVEAMEQPGVMLSRQPPALINKVINRAWSGPVHRVDRPLREGDEVAGFTVLDVPGHSRGHVAYWRESDRTLITGDVMNRLHPRGNLREPPAFFTPDIERNRESIRRVASLRPALACFGHGAPLRDPDAIEAFAAGLPTT